MKNNKPSFIQVFPILSYVTIFLLILVALLFIFGNKNVENFENHAPSPANADNKPIELECQKIFSTFKDKLQIINNY